MFITHFHLLAIVAQILKICSTIKFPEAWIWGLTHGPDFAELWKLERMGQDLETSLLSRPDLVPVHNAIRSLFRRLETPKHNGRDHESTCNALRLIRHEIGYILYRSQRLPIRPLTLVEQSNLEHFDRPFTYS